MNLIADASMVVVVEGHLEYTFTICQASCDCCYCHFKLNGLVSFLKLATARMQNNKF